jgi:hypothetical protein
VEDVEDVEVEGEAAEVEVEEVEVDRWWREEEEAVRR